MIQERLESTSLMREIMSGFAQRTGLVKDCGPPRRYLWTDAFAVCNFLELYRESGKERFLRDALRLVDQVHHVLGRHRKDDPREGWISGLNEREGELHPTLGGLRIGKKRNERRVGEPLDERQEWDRDGQYFHYLTKWMHALDRVARATGEARYHRWAVELAKAAHAGFSHVPPGRERRLLYWKMASLENWVRSDPLSLPLPCRLAFRELGLSIGLAAVGKIRDLIACHPGRFPNRRPLENKLANLARCLPWREEIDEFWLRSSSQKNGNWQAHREINSVMLATSLAPDSYLMLENEALPAASPK